MEKFLSGALKEWFGYTRRERRSTFLLLIIIMATVTVRFVVPERRMSAEIIPVADYRQDYSSVVSENGKIDVSEKRTYMIFNQSGAELLDLNFCDSAALEALPGIGPVLSARIIKYRNLLGGYASVEQLREVYGLKEETYNLIEKRVKASSSDVKQIPVNTATYKQLLRFPYIDRDDVSAILGYREREGKISNIEVLIENNLLDAEKAGKAEPYLDFR